MKETERCALFIDGSNFHATAKLLNIDIDYLKLLHFFRSRSTLIAPIITPLCLILLSRPLCVN